MVYAYEQNEEYSKVLPILWFPNPGGVCPSLWRWAVLVQCVVGFKTGINYVPYQVLVLRVTCTGNQIEKLVILSNQYSKRI